MMPKNPDRGEVSHALTEGDEILQIPLASCNKQKDELNGRFQHCEFGSCNHPTSVDAETTANTECLARLMDSGAVAHVETGAKTVSHKVAKLKFNTFLSYACGDYPKGV
jgi:hypothetical protein